VVSAEGSAEVIAVEDPGGGCQQSAGGNGVFRWRREVSGGTRAELADVAGDRSGDRGFQQFPAGRP
jgi:hypothetical protein